MSIYKTTTNEVTTLKTTLHLEYVLHNSTQKFSRDWYASWFPLLVLTFTIYQSSIFISFYLFSYSYNYISDI